MNDRVSSYLDPAAGPRRVAVAMSGGVDSSVAAAVALDSGADVTGVTLLLWGGERHRRSCSTADESAAAQAADALGIPLVAHDLRDRFTQAVVVPFTRAASKGVTANPCISCNRSFKLDWLFDWAVAAGFDTVVTGHHASVVRVGGRPRLARSVDAAKDQSYVLYRATALQLDRLWLPLGESDKSEVRRRAEALRLPAAQVADSMDLCFDPVSVLPGTTPAKVVAAGGRDLGTVAALERVTVGQRRGLGVSASSPLFVVAIDAATRTVTVDGAAAMAVTEVSAGDWHAVVTSDVLQARVASKHVSAQLSAHGCPVPVESVRYTDTGVLVGLASPCRRPAPGQHVVLFDSTFDDTGRPVDTVVAGGEITAG